MTRPFLLEKCENRDQIIKQFERMSIQLWSAFKHAEIIKNSFTDTHPKHKLLSEAMWASIGECIAYVEEARGHF